MLTRFNDAYMWGKRSYSSANKIFDVLRRNRSNPLSRAMGCIGELRAGYERFGTGNLAPLAVLVPIPKPATYSNSLREPATSILIVLYTFECIMWVATESLWRYVQATSEFSNFIFIFFRHVTEVMHWNDVLVTCYLYTNKQLYIYIYIYFRDINNHLLHYTFILTDEKKKKHYIYTYS